METNVSVKEIDGIIIFNIKGKLDETNSDDIFSNINKSIGNFSGKKVILNLKKLEYLNSKSIGYIIDIYKNCEENSGILYISNCQYKIYDILELTGIIGNVITYFNTEEEAIEKLK